MAAPLKPEKKKGIIAEISAANPPLKKIQIMKQYGVSYRTAANLFAMAYAKNTAGTRPESGSDKVISPLVSPGHPAASPSVSKDEPQLKLWYNSPPIPEKRRWLCLVDIDNITYEQTYAAVANDFSLLIKFMKGKNAEIRAYGNLSCKNHREQLHLYRRLTTFLIESGKYSKEGILTKSLADFMILNAMYKYAIEGDCENDGLILVTGDSDFIETLKFIKDDLKMAVALISKEKRLAAEIGMAATATYVFPF
jgi:hypothetical protein